MYCKNLSFVPYYELYLGTSSSSPQLIQRLTQTLWSSNSMSAGVFFWKVAAFNGFNRTFSQQRSFQMCNPGTLGYPILSPANGTLQIANVTLKWTVMWNDVCMETHLAILTIWNSTSILFMNDHLNDSQTSLFFNENDAYSLGLQTGSTYQWSVIAKKGTQEKQTYSTFEYCRPSCETVKLFSPGTVTYLVMFIY